MASKKIEKYNEERKLEYRFKSKEKYSLYLFHHLFVTFDAFVF